jgi:hypothetical protein
MSKKTKRERIISARDLLGLGESATIAEIKKAYRDKAKEHHPDTSEQDRQDEISMHRLTEAHDLLLEYCQSFKIPLNPSSDDPTDDEDWWMNRFGNDPLWGKKRD